MIIIVQNDPEVPAGRIAQGLAAANIPFRIVSAFAKEKPDPAERLSAAVVLGGSMGVHDQEQHPFLGEVREFMRRCLRDSVPLLGVCLGGQLLADLLGGTVTPRSGCGEKGVHAVALTPEGEADPLFRGAGSGFITFQWHDDSFDLPPGAVRLASSSCCPVQAFRRGRAYGIQFHPEVDEAIVACWSRGEKERYLEEYRGVEAQFADVGSLLLRNFLEIAGVAGLS